MPGKPHPLIHYASRKNISPEAAKAGLYLARLYARVHVTALGSNAALWKRAEAGGAVSTNYGITPSDPFMGQALQIERFGLIRAGLSNSQWELLYHVCIDEQPAGRSAMPALREALSTVIRLLNE